MTGSVICDLDKSHKSLDAVVHGNAPLQNEVKHLDKKKSEFKHWPEETCHPCKESL